MPNQDNRDQEYGGPERRAARLTEQDRQAIADAIWETAKRDLYLNAGKGVVNLVWKMVIGTVVLLAVYGYSHGWFH